MKPLERILETARARPAHIILPEGQDPRVREAARIAAAEGLARIGIASDPSFANFVLARFTDAAEAQAAAAALLEAGVLVRSTAGYRLPQCLRITLPRLAELPRVLDPLARFMAAR